MKTISMMRQILLLIAILCCSRECAAELVIPRITGVPTSDGTTSSRHVNLILRKVGIPNRGVIEGILVVDSKFAPLCCVECKRDGKLLFSFDLVGKMIGDKTHYEFKLAEDLVASTVITIGNRENDTIYELHLGSFSVVADHLDDSRSKGSNRSTDHSDDPASDK